MDNKMFEEVRKSILEFDQRTPKNQFKKPAEPVLRPNPPEIPTTPEPSQDASNPEEPTDAKIDADNTQQMGAPADDEATPQSRVSGGGGGGAAAGPSGKKEQAEPAIDPMKVKQIPDSGMEKEYFASKGTDEFFYINTMYTTDGQIEDRVVTDAADEELFSAKKAGLDVNDIANFFIKALEATGATLVDSAVMMKYVVQPEQDAAEEEKKATQKLKQDQARQEAEKKEPENPMGATDQGVQQNSVNQTTR